jgi:hypothetical protein
MNKKELHHEERGAAMREHSGSGTRHFSTAVSFIANQSSTKKDSRQQGKRRRPGAYPKWGIFEGDTWFKTIDKNCGQMLHTPPAIAFDKADVDAAESHPITLIVIFETSERKRYVATIATLLDKGMWFDRGYGRQLALPLQYWTVVNDGDDLPSPITPPDAPDENPPAIAQLEMFEVDYGRR